MNDVKNFIQALSALAEMSPAFARAAKGAGASKEETKELLDAYMRSVLYGTPADAAGGKDGSGAADCLGAGVL